MATLNGTAGPDTLIGDDSDISGIGGADIIRGGGGNDTIDGHGGTDQIYGDDGDDLIRFSLLKAHAASSTIDGGAGSDTLDLSGGTLAVMITETDPLNGIFTARWFDGIVAHTTEITSGSSIERFILGPQYSVLFLPNWSTPLHVQATYGYNRISTGTADDMIIGGVHGSTITLNGGNDVVVGGDGDNSFVIARISGNADHVRITGGSSHDMLRLEKPALAGQVVSVDLASGRASIGGTAISFSAIEDVALAGTGASTDIYGSDDDNRISARDSDSDLGIAVHGRGGSDLLDGGAGGDTLIGDGGDDYIAGGGGDDMLQGNDGHDWLEGDAYNIDQYGSDSIAGGAGNDHIWGSADTAAPSLNDMTDQADLIDGGAGADYVNGNGGADTIYGGDGRDRLHGGSGNDNIDGGDGPDQINGNKGNDTIIGGEGNDIIRGGQGDDVIAGGAGNDNLLGDLGDDTLVAGAGVDILTGGDGADRFDLSAPGAASIDPSGHFTAILDFTHGTDDLRIGFLPATADILRSSDEFGSVEAALLIAQRLLIDHAGSSAIAALQVGTGAYLFYNAAGSGDGINAVVALSGVEAAFVDSTDFM